MVRELLPNSIRLLSVVLAFGVLLAGAPMPAQEPNCCEDCDCSFSEYAVPYINGKIRHNGIEVTSPIEMYAGQPLTLTVSVYDTDYRTYECLDETSGEGGINGSPSANWTASAGSPTSAGNTVSFAWTAPSYEEVGAGEELEVTITAIVIDNDTTCGSCGSGECYDNNGPYDSEFITVIVKAPAIILETKHTPLSEWETSGTQIAAGGKSSNVHKADVRVTFDPPLLGDLEVEIYLSNGGAGYDPSSWWWGGDRTRATLAMAGGTYEYGVTSSPISYYPTSQIAGGVLTSSNALESTAIVIHIDELDISASSSVNFVVGEFEVEFENTPFEYNEWENFTSTMTVNGVAVDGHDLKYVVSKVTLLNGTVFVPELGEDEEGSEPLTDYVSLDGPAWVYSYAEDTTDGNGEGAGQFSVDDTDVDTFELTALDLSVASEPN